MKYFGSIICENTITLNSGVILDVKPLYFFKPTSLFSRCIVRFKYEKVVAVVVPSSKFFGKDYFVYLFILYPGSIFRGNFKYPSALPYGPVIFIKRFSKCHVFDQVVGHCSISLTLERKVISSHRQDFP